MICFGLTLFLVTAIPKWSDGMQVNMQGSISLGKEVMDTLSDIVNKNKMSGRRAFVPGKAELNDDQHGDSDTIAVIVNAAFLCRDFSFCQGDIRSLVNKYIIVLTKAVESVFEGLIDDIDKQRHENTGIKVVIFEDQLGKLIYEIKTLLRIANEKIKDKNQAIIWFDLMKKINAKFQDCAITFAAQRLEGNVHEITEVKNKVIQKLTIATTSIELQFINNLCAEYNICSKSHECSNALNTLLKEIDTATDEQAKEFMRYFYETLPSTNFYYRISDVTGHEFQSILHDMAYAVNIPTKNVLALIQQNVEERLDSISLGMRKDLPAGRDVKLVHIMLSDMDHFYSKLDKKEPFRDFLIDFFEWKKGGVRRFNNSIRRVMKDLQNMLSFESDELVLKLINEMRVFMEITVDPVP